MAELAVATWNAENAFGDQTHDPARFNDAMEMVKRMDAALLAIPETACNGVHSKEQDEERLWDMSDRMAKMGYDGFYTELGDDRNAHYLSLWSRVGHGHRFGDDRGHIQGATQKFGHRNGLFISVPTLSLDVYAAHGSDKDPDERYRMTQAMISHMYSHDSPGPRETLVLQDGNEMYRSDPKSRLPRLVGKLAGHLQFDYYDRSKPLKYMAGNVVRVSRMAGGQSLKALSVVGFHDADPSYQATKRSGPFGFQLDHILGSADIVFKNFRLAEPRLAPDGQPLSDHWAAIAEANFSDHVSHEL